MRDQHSSELWEDLIWQKRVQILASFYRYFVWVGRNVPYLGLNCSNSGWKVLPGIAPLFWPHYSNGGQWWPCRAKNSQFIELLCCGKVEKNKWDMKITKQKNPQKKPSNQTLIRVQQGVARPPSFALLCACCTPYSEGLFLCGIILGRLLQLLPRPRDQQLAELSRHSFLKSLHALQSSKENINRII